MASHTPFDQILVLVNDKTSGATGADVPTMNLGEDPKESLLTLKHELAHSVGMMADEYKYFSDQRAILKCKNNQFENEVRHSDKRWGRNKYYESQFSLAPNISNLPDPKKIKWKNFLTDDSPIVYFNYPQSALESVSYTHLTLPTR